MRDRRQDSRQARTCDCSARLLASGLCSATGGYPASARCPHACPICRGPLGWEGGCERCHGCTTGQREDWTFLGDRYELDKGHWQKVDGPRKACTPEQNAAGFAAIRTLLGRVDYLRRGRTRLPRSTRRSGRSWPGRPSARHETPEGA